MKASEFRFGEQPFEELLARISAGPAPPGAGTVAALAAAMAAGLVAMAARSVDARGIVAQAEALRAQLVDLAEEDALALDFALGSLAGAGSEAASSPETRDFLLGRALVRAADAPLRIAEACESVALLGAQVAGEITGPLDSDARGAASLAEGCARVAAALVEVNLATAEGDVRLERARAAAAGAAAAVSRATME